MAFLDLDVDARAASAESFFRTVQKRFLVTFHVDLEEPDVGKPEGVEGSHWHLNGFDFHVEVSQAGFAVGARHVKLRDSDPVGKGHIMHGKAFDSAGGESLCQARLRLKRHQFARRARDPV